MLALATSVLSDYPLIWIRDPALKQPEYPPDAVALPDEPPDAFEKRKAERAAVVAKLDEEFEAAWSRAIETRQWDSLKREGATPTVFWCRQIPGPKMRALLDYTHADANIGGSLRPCLVFRLAVVRIDNFGTGHKVELVEHVDKNGERTGLGKVLSDDVIATLDAHDMRIVSVLGYSILTNRLTPHPL